MKKFFIILLIICFAFSSFAEELIEPIEENLEENITIEPNDEISEYEKLFEPIDEILEEAIDIQIEKVEIEFDPQFEEDEYVIIEEEPVPLGVVPSVKFSSSHDGKTVKEGTKITLTASIEGFPDNAEIIWEYTDDGGATVREFASGKTCSFLASKETENRLYRAVVRLP